MTNVKWDKAKTKRWMQQHIHEYVDRKTDEVNYTYLAEQAADEFNIYEDTRDYTIPEEVFDLAIDVGTAWERKNRKASTTYTYDRTASSLRWKPLFPRSHSSYGHFFDAVVDTPEGKYSFRIEPLTGPGGEHKKLLGKYIYELTAHTPGGVNMRYRRQLPDIEKLKSVADAFAKTLQVPAGGVDFSREWSKYASYDRREARYTGTPEKLFKQMKEGVDSVLEARVKVRRIHEALSEIASDASGVSFMDNYNDPEIRRVSKLLYELDNSMGEGFRAIERMERDLQKKVK